MSGAFAITLLMVVSATAVSIEYSESVIKDEGKIRPEEALIVELEKFFEFEGITPEQIKESLPLVDDSKEQLLDIEDNSEEPLLPEIEDIEEALDLMMGSSTPVNPVGSGDTEYWAVLIGADFNWYYNHFIMRFDKNVECMYNLLLASNHWQANHIKVLKNEDVTVANIVGALLWLDMMDDDNDISLVYYTAHGAQLRIKNKKLGIDLPIDLPPVDEEDGCDEFITTHWTGRNPFSIITDDLLNYLLNRLDSQGIAVLIDACHSGGMFDSNHQNMRVMMASCEEHELGAGIRFAKFMMKGMQGYADDINEGGNDDGMVSAEEAFSYATPRYIDFSNEFCHPVIKDEYDGELQLTDVKLPPSPPSWINGPLIGNTNILYNFSVVSTDPEDHKIRYGWDWDSKAGYKLLIGYPYFYPVPYKVFEWTEFFPSGTSVCMHHSWNEPGVYDIRVKSQDDSGFFELDPRVHWSVDWTTIITSDDELVDQFQTEDISANVVEDDQWCAQSFIPNLEKLSKVALELDCFDNNYTVDFLIRSDLTGDNLVEISKNIEGDCSWIDFVFPEDLSVTPGETYYMILGIQNIQGPYWVKSYQNPYPRGKAYVSEDSGQSWSSNKWFIINVDFCFVTYSQCQNHYPNDQCQQSSSQSNPSSSQQSPTSFTSQTLQAIVKTMIRNYLLIL